MCLGVQLSLSVYKYSTLSVRSSAALSERLTIPLYCTAVAYAFPLLLSFPSPPLGCVGRPKESVWRTIIPTVQAMRQQRSSVIGIHMRTTDSFAWKGKGFSLNTIANVTDHTLLQCAKVQYSTHSTRVHTVP